MWVRISNLLTICSAHFKGIKHVRAITITQDYCKGVDACTALREGMYEHASREH